MNPRWTLQVASVMAHRNVEEIGTDTGFDVVDQCHPMPRWHRDHPVPEDVHLLSQSWPPATIASMVGGGEQRRRRQTSCWHTPCVPPETEVWKFNCRGIGPHQRKRKFPDRKCWSLRYIGLAKRATWTIVYRTVTTRMPITATQSRHVVPRYV